MRARDDRGSDLGISNGDEISRAWWLIGAKGGGEKRYQGELHLAGSRWLVGHSSERHPWKRTEFEGDRLWVQFYL